MSFSGFVAVGIGATVGAWLRWGLNLAFNATFATISLGTLLANLIGAYFIGLLMGLFTLDSTFSPELRLFLVTGLLGGLTTFSTFSAEAVTLLNRSEYAWAMAHILLHVCGSLILTGLGWWTIQFIKS